MLHHRLSCGADKGEPGYPDPEIKGEGVVSKFFFFSALWASVCSKIKGGGGTGPLGPFTESATSKSNTLMSVVGEVCKDKKKFFKKQKTKKNKNSNNNKKN